MPYKYQIEKMKMRREDDRRVKHSLEDYRTALSMIKNDGLSQREVARQTGISRRMLSFLLHPERQQRCVELHESSKYYPGKDKWREQMKDHRRYKQKLYKLGRLSK